MITHNTIKSMKDGDFEHFKNALEDCYSDKNCMADTFRKRYHTILLLNRMICIYPEDSEKILDMWEQARHENKRKTQENYKRERRY
jgi:uncharacterized membrane protein